MKLSAGFRLLLVLACAVTASADEFPPPKSLGDVSGRGRNIQRAMRLMATSTPERRNTVRVLFYGQSITEQGWWKLVADDLRARFPHADLVIENRALGGFASQLLVKTAETDLYASQPDLLIIHVYGSHDKYEDILRRARERTCAEILQQNDHLTKAENFSEPTDPAKATIQAGNWDAFMNHNWLPGLARKYGTELCDQRSLWKQYLRDYELEPKALLKDNVHLNARGEFLMAKIVQSYLRYDPKLGPSPAEEWVKTIEAGKDASWTGGKLRVEFEGNRVDVICKPGVTGAVSAQIDGKKPSEFPELYGFTRALAKPGGKWPPIAPITSDKPLVLEDWTMRVRSDAANDKLFTFTLEGSKTGPDGEGRSDQRFVSKSGRVVIAPDAWNVPFALGALAGQKPVASEFVVRWSVVPQFVDEFTAPASAKNPGTETTVTVAQGLTNGRHVLELSGPAEAVLALRVYRPLLGRE
jgi:hypothetical protein